MVLTPGIMAGGYKGNITHAKTNDNDRSYKVTGPNPFYGCATESELVASCGDLRDQYIAFGVDDVVQMRNYQERSQSHVLSTFH